MNAPMWWSRSPVPGKAVDMAVLRVEKDTNYTTMCNYHLRDKRLSLKAKGLLSMCLSLPDEWHYSVRGIAAISKEGVDGINSTLKELEQHGYLTRHQTRQAGGRLGETEYVIYEQPRMDSPYMESPCTEKPYTAKPVTEKPCTENPARINKDISSTEEASTEKIKERESKRPVRHKYGQYRNVLLSDEEMEKLMREYPNDYQKRIERLSEYMASTGKIYKNHLATIRSWAKRDEEKRQGGKAAKQYDHGNYQYAAGDSL